MHPINLRAFCAADLEAVAQLFTASVHRLTKGAYSAAQRAAWAPEPPDLAQWHTRLAGLSTLLAEQDGVLLGFIAYETNGHIDLLFSAVHAVRQGVASRLYQEVENRLVAAGVAEIVTEASLIAQPFFVHHGFEVIATQTVTRGEVSLQRYAMRKQLNRLG